MQKYQRRRAAELRKRLKGVDYHRRNLKLTPFVQRYFQEFGEYYIREHGGALWSMSMIEDALGQLSELEVLQEHEIEDYRLDVLEAMVEVRPSKKDDGMATWLMDENPEHSEATGRLLIEGLQRDWERYCDSPSKMRLKSVFRRLDMAALSNDEKVLAERRRCLRSANLEAKDWGL